VQRAPGSEAAATGAIRDAAVEPKGRTGTEATWKFQPFRLDEIIKMAKSKNSSQHNQNKKAHRNGIKKPKTYRYPSLKGTDPKFRRNHRHALHGTMKALKERKEGKRDVA
jgi:large subunit ribosomal protein L29e